MENQKKTSILIIKETPNTWTLRMAFNVGTDNEIVTRQMFKTLIAALEVANVLKLHVDNEQRLPLRQYLKLAS